MEQISGKAVGAKARADKLTPEQRSEIARQAAEARWSGNTNVLQATHIGELKIGDAVIPCAVLEDGTRVVSERGLIKSFGGKRGGSYWRRKKESADGAYLPPVVTAKNLKPFVDEVLGTAPLARILYRSKGGRPAHGLKAELYPKVCNVFLKARDANVLKPNQREIAVAADILMRGLAEIGIIALVDEATGYQRDRASDALSRILEAFIAKELQPWVKTFPTEYYEQLFRLRGLEYPTGKVQRPQYFGVLTNDIVYRRLAPGVLEELKKVVPRNEDGRPTAKYFQKLTSNIGYPKLREHLGAVVAAMKLSTDYRDFMQKLDFIRPRYGQQLLLGVYEPDSDNGKGL
jgi:P63C domain-containing protein